MHARTCLFASDLHGAPERYQALERVIRAERHRAVFLGGDLLPASWAPRSSTSRSEQPFVDEFLAPMFEELRATLGEHYPRVLLILGNDDPRSAEPSILRHSASGLWDYVHQRMVRLGDTSVFGYALVPPTPFHLKDWERYDVSRFVDPGCVSPEEGARTVEISSHEARFSTIAADLEDLAGGDDLTDAVFLFHSPPYQTCLDRAALDGMSVEHAPLDVHVGSIAIRRFIEKRQPLLTLHGHVHESARITGSWRDKIGRTVMLSAAHDGPELALVHFDPERLDEAFRRLI